MSNHDWDNNLAKVFIALINLVREFKLVVSVIVLGGAFALGWLNVPIFEAIVDGFVRFAQAAVPGL